MSLIEIKAYLMRVKIATHASICSYFQCDPELMHSMMGHWLKKGCVRKFTQPPSCGSCTQCVPSAVEIYEWIQPIAT